MTGQVLGLLAAVAISAIAFQNCTAGVRFGVAEMASLDAASDGVIPPGIGVIPGGSPAFVPDPFAFIDQADAVPGSSVISNLVILSGSGTVPVPALCKNCLAQKNNAGPFTATLDSLLPGDSVRIRVNAAISGNTVMQAILQVGATESQTWTVTTAAPDSSANQCVADVGHVCDRGTNETVSGCGQPGYVCASFVGIYYGASGCNPQASSYLEYSFDGTNELYSGTNSAGVHKDNVVLGDASSAYHCTYLSTANDPFKAMPDGQCHAAPATFAIANTYTKVVPGMGCTHVEHTQVLGVVACDGTCQ